MCLCLCVSQSLSAKYCLYLNLLVVVTHCCLYSSRQQQATAGNSRQKSAVWVPLGTSRQHRMSRDSVVAARHCFRSHSWHSSSMRTPRMTNWCGHCDLYKSGLMCAVHSESSNSESFIFP